MTTTGPVLPATDPAQRVADAVLLVDGVHRVGSALGRVIDRYLPAPRVPGVRLPGDGGTARAEVTIVAEYPVEVVALADRVRLRAAAVLGTDAVDVVVADVHGPFDRDEVSAEPVPEDGGEGSTGPVGAAIADDPAPVLPDGTGAAGSDAEQQS